MSSLTPRLDRLDKNYIINGNFDFWQRGTDITQAEGPYFTDRFKGWAVNRAYTLGQSMRIARSTDVPNVNSKYSLSLYTANATTGHLGISQRIESNFCKNLEGKVGTLSFYVKRIATIPAGHKLNIRITSPGTADTYPGTDRDILGTYLAAEFTASSLSTSWTKITLPISTMTNASKGIVVLMWLTTDIATGSELASTQEQIRISQVQLIEGTHTDPEFTTAGRNYTEELQLCQRYYEKSFEIDTPPANGPNAGAFVTNAGLVYSCLTNTGDGGWIAFKVTKRVIPILTRYGNNSGHWICQGSYNSLIAITSASSHGFAMNQQVVPGAGNITGHFAADAEI